MASLIKPLGHTVRVVEWDELPASVVENLIFEGLLTLAANASTPPAGP